MNINDLMKQAQQMQGKMAEMQEQAANAEVTGESGAEYLRSSCRRNSSSSSRSIKGHIGSTGGGAQRKKV